MVHQIIVEIYVTMSISAGLPKQDPLMPSEDCQPSLKVELLMHRYTCHMNRKEELEKTSQQFCIRAFSYVQVRKPANKCAYVRSFLCKCVLTTKTERRKYCNNMHKDKTKSMICSQASEGTFLAQV
jgi:hypothetical protein